MNHTSILLEAAVDGLNIKPEGVYVDGTLGRGGHSSYLLSQLTTGFLYAFDQDEAAIQESLKRLSVIGSNFALLHCNFTHMKEELLKRGVEEVDGMMFDLGVSSPQFDDAQRGFSYHATARLDMRMDQRQALDAYTIVNTYSYEQLTHILFTYGEENFAKSIVRRIEARRAVAPIVTTADLVEVIKEGIPMKFHAGKHPARKTFQALRIAVNDELHILEAMLETCLKMLKINGRMSVLTFHSLEDRIVKERFHQVSSLPKLPRNMPIKDSERQADYQLVNRKVITPKTEEVEQNPRARSAKLRIIERIR